MFLTLSNKMEDTILALLIAILTLVVMGIVFIPANRRAMKSIFRSAFKWKQRTILETYYKSLKDLLEELSSHKVGALITFERDLNIEEYTKTGLVLNTQFSPELIWTLLQKNSRLHDGAIIINKQWHIISCSSYFPTSEQPIPSTYGARHRAALGISEESDCISFVVSEETGKISLVKRGKIHHVPHSSLKKVIWDSLS